MSSSIDSYANGIYNRFQHHAAWPPNTTLRIGDIGTLEGHLFQYRSNLKTMGIHFGIYPASPPIDLEHSSGYTFALNPSISGQATAASSVGIEAKAQISFDSGGAFVFQAMEWSAVIMRSRTSFASRPS